MADVQMYRFNGSSWVEINPKPAGHTHAIADVSGLQTALNGKVNHTVTVGNNIDLDTIKTSGFYRLSGTHPNMPSGGAYGQLIVSRGGDTTSQIIISYASGNMWFRGMSDSGSWYAWRTVWHNVNFNPDNFVLNNDSRLTNARPASDVHPWAKAANKPTYSWTEVTDKPIISVSNTATGSGTEPMAVSHSILKAAIEAVSPPGSRPASDVYSWAKASNKPSYNLGEISETTTYKRVTQAEKDAWNNKWKLIYSGPSSSLSKTSTTSVPVPSDIYAGKTIAVEFRINSSSGTTYQKFVAIATVGTSSNTSGSKTVPRYLTVSEWDGSYLKFISTKCFASTTSEVTSLMFGYLKTLVGHFSGTTINWTTQENDNILVYIGKIWVVE